MCLNLVRVCVHILLKICDCISVSVCIKGGTKNIGFIFHTPFNERFLSSDFLRRRVMNLQNVKLSLQVCSLSKNSDGRPICSSEFLRTGSYRPAAKNIVISDDVTTRVFSSSDF